MPQLDLTPLEIRDYAVSIGWSLVREALEDGLYVLNSPERNSKQLIFPASTDREDFAEMAKLAIDKLSSSLEKPSNFIIEEIREVYDDVLCLKYYSEQRNINSIAFTEAIESLEAAKRMILAASSSVIYPSLYHPRLSRTEAMDTLNKTKFRHTKEGSFIIKISSPIEIERIPAQLSVQEELNKPLSRRTFETIRNSTAKIFRSIEEDSLRELYEEQRSIDNPIVSYNLCDALIDLFDDERGLPYELSFQWSKFFNERLPTSHGPTSIKFPYEFKPKIEELKTYFEPQNPETIDTFIGTVESLNGNERSDGRRSGEVSFSLLIDNQITLARANLSADQYNIAYTSHGQSGSYIKVTGRLLPGKRIRLLSDISNIEPLR